MRVSVIVLLTVATLVDGVLPGGSIHDTGSPHSRHRFVILARYA